MLIHGEEWWGDNGVTNIHEPITVSVCQKRYGVIGGRLMSAAVAAVEHVSLRSSVTAVLNAIRGVLGHVPSESSVTRS